MTASDAKRRWARWRDRLRDRPKADFGYRIVVAVIGLAVLGLGILAIPYPGPGWAIVFVGLGMLALEFKWAENLMEKILDRLEAAKKSASAASPLQKALMTGAAAVGIAAFAVAAILWDIPLLPVL